VRPEGIHVEVAIDQAVRAFADDDLARLGEGLEAGSHVRRIANRKLFVTLAAAHLADNDEPGIDAHANGDGWAVLPLTSRAQIGDVIDQREAGPDRSAGVVLMGRRVTEICEDAIAQVLRHIAPVGGNSSRGDVLIGTYDLSEILGVKSLR